MNTRDFDASPERLEQLSLGLQFEADDEAGSSTDRIEDKEIRSRAAQQALDLKYEGKEPEDDWYADYLQLLNSGWPWRVAAYIAWASSPKQHRQPKTQEELATQVLGLTSDRVIATWRKKNPGIDTTIALLQAAPLLKYRRDVFDALAKSAMDPDYKHHNDRKLFVEMTGDHVPRSVVKQEKPLTGNEDWSEYSEAELRELSGSIEKVLDEKEADDDADTD